MNVYLILDPANRIVRYVGITKHNPKHRLMTHIKDSKSKLKAGGYLSKKDKWMIECARKGVRPIVEAIFKDVSNEEAIRLEKEAISVFGRESEGGQLYNVSEGGDYNGVSATPWNVGIPMSETLKSKMKLNQPNRRAVVRYSKDGSKIDSWQSVRAMCSELGFDRRTVQRILLKVDNYVSHKGFMFSYEGDAAPKYLNKSTKMRGSNSPHSKEIEQRSIDGDLIKIWGSTREASEKCYLKEWKLGDIVRSGGGEYNGYIWKFKQ